MKNKIVAVVIVVLILIGGAVGLWLKQKSKPEETVSEVTEEKVLKPTTAEIKSNKKWQDEAGFTFEYPEALTIKQDITDTKRYANLEIGNGTVEAKIVVLAEDTIYKDVNDWVKKDKKLSGSSATDVTVGGKAAKKITFADSERVLIGLIDDGILFSLELSDGKETTMATAFETITKSFELVVPTSAAGSGSGQGASQSQGEEIIEEETIEE